MTPTPANFEWTASKCCYFAPDTPPLPPEMLDRTATIAGAVLTLMVFSYLLGDNFLYRIAIHIFIGAAAAYTVIVAVESVIVPWVTITLVDPNGGIPQRIYGIIPFLIGFLLLLKLIPTLSRVGN